VSKVIKIIIALLLILSLSSFSEGLIKNSPIQASAQTPTSTQVYGLNINFYDNPTNSSAWKNPSWITGLVELGAQWVRFESRYYNKTIFETNASKLNLAPLEMCKMAKQNGLKTLAVLDEKVSPYTIDHFSPIASLDEWRNIVQGQLDGYGSYLDAVEMWNEPDLDDQTEALSKGWYMDGPEHYVDMLRVLYEEVQNYNNLTGADILVIAGALGTVRTLDAEELWDSGGFFLQAIVDAPLNAALYCDYFSIHVYDGYLYPNSDTEESEGLFDVEDAYLKAQSIVGEKPIWITEVGANHAFTEASQAEFMNATAFGTLRQTDCPLVFWYCYYNPRIEITDPSEALHGLVNQDDQLTKREAYFMFQEYAFNTIPDFQGSFFFWMFAAMTIIILFGKALNRNLRKEARAL
jgi:hypothetical protein